MDKRNWISRLGAAIAAADEETVATLLAERPSMCLPPYMGAEAERAGNPRVMALLAAYAAATEARDRRIAHEIRRRTEAEYGTDEDDRIV